MKSVGDIGGNIVVSQTVSWVAHYFSSSFQKLVGNEYCSKLEKKFRLQVIFTSNISYFLEFPPGYLNLKVFKVVSRMYSHFWHIQNPRYIFFFNKQSKI